MIRIRFANKNDAPAIFGLIRELAEFEKLLHAVQTDLATLTASLFGARPAAEVILAEVSGEIVGCSIFFHNFSTFLGRHGLYLEDLFVKVSHRNQGIGRDLLATLAQLAVERGCGRMEWSVLNWNQKAIELYQKIGAEPQSEWTVFRLTGNALSNLASNAPRLSPN